MNTINVIKSKFVNCKRCLLSRSHLVCLEDNQYMGVVGRYPCVQSRYASSVTQGRAAASFTSPMMTSSSSRQCSTKRQSSFRSCSLDTTWCVPLPRCSLRTIVRSLTLLHSVRLYGPHFPRVQWKGNCSISYLFSLRLKCFTCFQVINQQMDMDQ